MEKLLITGVDSTIGTNLVLALQQSWHVAALCGGLAPSDTLPVVACDLGDPLDIRQQLVDESPAWVVHCGDWSRSSWDLAGINFEPAREVHIAAALAEACRQQGVRLCTITSDAQFAGPRMFHPESAAAVPGSPLCETARAIEQAVLGSGSLVVRTHAYGWSPSGDDTSFAHRVWRTLNDGSECPVDDDRYATPILVNDLAEQLHEALVQRWQGIYHITGVERTNQRRFAAELAVAFGFTGRVVPLVRPSRPVGRPLVDETSLNTALARRKLTRPLPMLREGLARFAELAESGWREQLETLQQGESGYVRAA